jgi:hypothetical protein
LTDRFFIAETDGIDNATAARLPSDGVIVDVVVGKPCCYRDAGDVVR